MIKGSNIMIVCIHRVFGFACIVRKIVLDSFKKKMVRLSFVILKMEAICIWIKVEFLWLVLNRGAQNLF